MKKNVSLFLLLIPFFLSSCFSYAGRRVTIDYQKACDCRTLPAKCSGADDNFRFDYDVISLDEPWTYLAEGTATYIGPVKWQNHESVFMSVMPVRNNMIVDSFSMTVRSGEMSKPIKFKKEFQVPGAFDFIGISYKMRVSD